MVWFSYYTALTHTHVNTMKTVRWNVYKMAVVVDIQEISVFMYGIISLP